MINKTIKGIAGVAFGIAVAGTIAGVVKFNEKKKEMQKDIDEAQEKIKKRSELIHENFEIMKEKFNNSRNNN